MENQKTEIRIYVACLASYNSGILHGAWIDALQDASAIRNEIKAMLDASPEECAENGRSMTMKALKARQFPNIKALIAWPRLRPLLPSMVH